MYISVFLLEQMVQCMRDVAGVCQERMPKATIMIHWGLPSWETSTVSSLFSFCFMSIIKAHDMSRKELLFLWCLDSILLVFIMLLFLISVDTPSMEAVSAVKLLLQSGVSQGLLHPDFVLKGHRDLDQTECPGEKLYVTLSKLKWFPDIKLTANYDAFRGKSLSTF